MQSYKNSNSEYWFLEITRFLGKIETPAKRRHDHEIKLDVQTEELLHISPAPLKNICCPAVGRDELMMLGWLDAGMKTNTGHLR